MIQTSETTKELYTALAAAQKDIGFAMKDTDNPFFKKKYADLASVWRTVQDPLAKNSLSVSQSPGMELVNGSPYVTVTTRIQHSSGEWMQGVCYLPPGKSDAQSYGSVITYGRRYALSAILGVIQEDDDGESAVGRGKQEPAAQETKPAQKKQKATAAEKPGQKGSQQSGTKADRLTEIKSLAKFLMEHGASNIDDYNYLLCKCQGSVDGNPNWEEVKADASLDLEAVKQSVSTWVKANHLEPHQVLATLKELEQAGATA